MVSEQSSGYIRCVDIEILRLVTVNRRHWHIELFGVVNSPSSLQFLQINTFSHCI